MEAVDARVATYWNVTDPTTSAAVPYYGLNETGETPADGGAFLVTQYPLANAQQMSIGAPGAQVFREEGVIRFVLAVPRGQGVYWWIEQLEGLTANFRAKKFGSGINVNTWVPTSPVLDDSNDDPAYWRLSSATPYYADTFG